MARHIHEGLHSHLFLVSRALLRVMHGSPSQSAGSQAASLCLHSPGRQGPAADADQPAEVEEAAAHEQAGERRASDAAPPQSLVDLMGDAGAISRASSSIDRTDRADSTRLASGDMQRIMALFYPDAGPTQEQEQGEVEQVGQGASTTPAEQGPPGSGAPGAAVHRVPSQLLDASTQVIADAAVGQGGAGPTEQGAEPQPPAVAPDALDASTQVCASPPTQAEGEGEGEARAAEATEGGAGAVPRPTAAAANRGQQRPPAKAVEALFGEHEDAETTPPRTKRRRSSPGMEQRGPVTTPLHSSSSSSSSSSHWPGKAEDTSADEGGAAADRAGGEDGSAQEAAAAMASSSPPPRRSGRKRRQPGDDGGAAAASGRGARHASSAVLPPAVREQFQKGQEAFQRRGYAAAATRFSTALRQLEAPTPRGPDGARAARARVRGNLLASRLAAFANLGRELEQAGSGARASLDDEEGTTVSAFDCFQRAVADGAAALRVDSTNPKVWRNYVSSMDRLGKGHDAERELESAIAALDAPTGADKDRHDNLTHLLHDVRKRRMRARSRRHAEGRGKAQGGGEEGGRGDAQGDKHTGREGALAPMPQRLRERSPTPPPRSRPGTEGGNGRRVGGGVEEEEEEEEEERREESPRGGGEAAGGADRRGAPWGAGEVPAEPSAADLAQMKEVAREVERLKLRVKDLQAVLRRNDQSRSGRRAQLVWRVADVKVRGRLPPCPRCEGHLDVDPSKKFVSCRGRWSNGEYRSCSYEASATERLPYVDGNPM